MSRLRLKKTTTAAALAAALSLSFTVAAGPLDRGVSSREARDTGLDSRVPTVASAPSNEGLSLRGIVRRELRNSTRPGRELHPIQADLDPMLEVFASGRAVACHNPVPEADA